jgi:hypothetical protein
MRRITNTTTSATPYTHTVAELLPKVQNSSQAHRKNFKTPTFICDLKLFMLIPRVTEFCVRACFTIYLKSPSECWARPRILPQVSDVIPPKIRFFVRSRSYTMRFRNALLSGLTDGQRHFLLPINCDCWHVCLFTTMTSVKDDVTFKNPWKLLFNSMVTEGPWILHVT